VHFDALKFRFREFQLRRDPNCPVCGEHPTVTELIDYDAFCGLSRGDTSDSKPMIPEITVHELKERIASEAPFTLIDVREPNEHDICRLPDAILIPLGELANRLHELDPDADIVVHCKAGGRSAKAIELLMANGFERVCHVAGGINAWSKEIDPSVPHY
ncbi:MAG: molybdenum cofactor biosynthesis protein MoeB, partial [Verrucomicrobiae bacterium]|nr:molybdenum cofactor biosynthesis protein MoeB [Verrucomicrobiae bacterium]